VGQFVITNARYVAGQSAGLFLKTSRYPYFAGQWILLLFILAIAVAHLYAWARQTLGPGPGAALRVGFLAGFLAGFQSNLAQANWFPGDRALPFGWMIDLWLGAILAALVAGWLYKD
jgi:hypothetical protein